MTVVADGVLGGKRLAKIDYKKELGHLYRPSAKEVVVVDVPALNYLAIDGRGDPNRAQSYKEAVEALYSLSYTLKFMVKRGPSQVDYGVLPLEGLWWTDDMSTFSVDAKDQWKWTLMIMQPDFISTEMVAEATSQVRKKKEPPALSRVRFEPFCEGKAAQTLHIGPFSEEGPTVERVHAYIEACGSEKRGRHHEIYLSDIRRAAPEKWRTIIRQPMT